MLLPDVNVWLALTFDSHAHHSAAKVWFDGLTTDTCCFCRMTQQGFLRLASNASVFKQNALKLPDAWKSFDLLMADPKVSFADEPFDVETHWRAFTGHQSFSPHVWNDAYLAAFALAAEMTVVTFDKGFTQYRQTNCTILQ